MASDTLIDLYCHVSPARFLDEMNKVAPKLGNIAARLRGVPARKSTISATRGLRKWTSSGDYRPG